MVLLSPSQCCLHHCIIVVSSLPSWCCLHIGHGFVIAIVVLPSSSHHCGVVVAVALLWCPHCCIITVSLLPSWCCIVAVSLSWFCRHCHGFCHHYHSFVITITVSSSLSQFYCHCHGVAFAVTSSQFHHHLTVLLLLLSLLSHHCSHHHHIITAIIITSLLWLHCHHSLWKQAFLQR